MVISKQTLLYLSFFALIAISPEHIPLPFYFPDYLADMIDHFDRKNNFGQFLAYVWGEKVFMSYKHVQWHDALYLQHLFTPSGVHLSSLLILFKLFPKKGKIFHTVEFLVLISTFIPVGLYPLKRIALFRICSKINQLFLQKRFRETSVFLFAFALDFFFGYFDQNPMSFSLSYLFIGTLLIVDNRSLIRFFCYLFMTQLLVSVIFFKPFYPLAFIIGMLLSTIFAFLFPVLIAGLVTYPFLTNFSEYFLSLYTKLLGFFYHPLVFKWEMINHLLWALLILLFSLKIETRKKIAVLVLILLICPNLGNAPEKFSGFYQKKKYPQYVRRSLSDL